jgi:hypothetical protein
MACNFDTIDKWAIHTILNFLCVSDILTLKQCNKRLKRYVNDYLGERYFSSTYLLNQRHEIQKKIIKIQAELNRLHKCENKIKTYMKHGDVKPYVYLKKLELSEYNNITRVSSDFMKTSPKAFTTHYIETLSQIRYSLRYSVILIKSGQSFEVEEKCVIQMKRLGYILILVPRFAKRILSNPNYKKICFISKKIFNKKSKDCNLVEFYKCKICKTTRYHTLKECPNVKCNICGEKGHLTSKCSLAKCKKCGGNHLTSRCPKIVCHYCKKKGHTSKKCLRKKRNKK